MGRCQMIFSSYCTISQCAGFRHACYFFDRDIFFTNYAILSLCYARIVFQNLNNAQIINKQRNMTVTIHDKGFFISAFTLIELLVVIAIIGTLASTILASLNNVRPITRETRNLAAMKQVQTALEFYFDDFGRYPDTGGVWFLSCSDPTNYVPGLAPTYISVLPGHAYNCATVPLTGSIATIEYRSDGFAYKLSMHNETQDLRFRAFFDPTRDGGTNCAIVDGTAPNHMSIWQPASACW